MSKIFGILTAIVLAIAGFVAFKNKAATEQEITARQEIQEALAKSEARLKKAQDDLAATEKDHAEVKAEIPKAESQKAQQQKTNDELTATKASKTGEVEANKAKLDQIREKTAALGNVRSLADEMSRMINDTKSVEDGLKLADSKLAALTAESNRVDTLVTKQKNLAELVNKGESFPTLRTYISAIYPNWGFVTLGAGNTSGVITNSTLDVVRNDEVIAKLLVTAVERSTASASIVPESVKADTVLAVGDRVVPGVSAEATAAPIVPASAKPAN
jgi:hypothetical protein